MKEKGSFGRGQEQMRLTLQQRQAVTKAIAERYRKASRREKGTILDEFCALTGYNRSYAARVLREGPKAKGRRGPGRPRKKAEKRKRQMKYGDDVFVALRKIWAVSDGICSKRLHPFLPEMVRVMERCGELELKDEVRKRLLQVSPATMDRLLSAERQKLKIRGRSRTRPGMMLKHQVPIRTFADWDEVVPGFLEMDTVSHDGGHPTGGRFIHSLDATDIATCWTELSAFINKEAALVLSAIEEIRERCPFDLKGIDTDGGGEFINSDLISWCRDERITFTRSRPWRKNDSCYVEQKNYSVVRRLVGYAKYDTPEELEVIQELYSYARLYVNFFQPTQKLVRKERIGSRVKKTYDEAKTPYRRVLESPHIPKRVKRELAKEYESLNPVDLKRLITELQLRLLELAAFKGRVSARQDTDCGITSPTGSLIESSDYEYLPI
jgi:hypothetical protein